MKRIIRFTNAWLLCFFPLLLNACTQDADPGQPDAPADTPRMLEAVLVDYYYGPDAMGDLSPQWYTVVLFTDGSARRDVETALPTLDRQKDQAENPELWSTWRKAGPDYVVEWEDEDEPDTLKAEMKKMPFPANATLSGYFYNEEGGTNPNTGSSFQALTYIDFLPDKRFESGGYMSFTATELATESDYMASGGNTGKKKTGTYTLNGYTLRLQYDDGTASERLIYWFDTKKETLIIDGATIMWLDQ